MRKTKAEITKALADLYPSLEKPSQLGRFLWRAGINYQIIYCGPAERYLLSKCLILANPDLISENWLETHKAKFDESDDNITIKREFRHLPFIGITPFQILQKMGEDCTYRNPGFNVISLSHMNRVSCLVRPS